MRRQKHASHLGLDAAENLIDDARSPEAVVSGTEERRQIDECLGELEGNDATIIQAAYFGGKTYEILAQQSAVPLGTMKSRIRRSLARLRDCLEKRNTTLR